MINMILTQYVIGLPCKLSCDFSKLTILYIYMYIYSIIFMTNKSVITFLYVNKNLSIYLSIGAYPPGQSRISQKH